MRHSHYVRFAQPRPSMGHRVSDEWVVPLCMLHHRSLRDAGDERRWWQSNRIDLESLSQLIVSIGTKALLVWRMWAWQNDNGGDIAFERYLCAVAMPSERRQ